MKNNAVKDRQQPRNLILAALLVVITLFTAFHEGYLPLISPLFWVSLIAGFAICVWLALTISTRRFLSLILVIFIMEYFKETIGVRSKLWTYQGINGFYNFGVWAWVLGGLITYCLATRVVIRLIRTWAGSKGFWSKPPFHYEGNSQASFQILKWLNPLILTAIFLTIPLTLGKYWNGTGALFWLFYLVLLCAGIYASSKMDFPVFAGIVITAWVVGNPSEYLGSISSGVWSFTHNPKYPPFFLLFACWPLEILAQYGLSAFLANETLDNYTL